MPRRPRLRRLLLLLRLLPPLPDLSVVPALAGAIRANFAIPLASRFVVLDRPYEPHDAAGGLGCH